MRGSRPVNFMTKLQIHWPMQCQWNTERVSHFHQGSQHWESWNSHHHRGKTRGAYQATALDDLGVSPQRQDTERMSSYRFRYNNASPCNVSGTRSAYPTFTMVANISPGTPLGHHHRGKTRGACQATALDTPCQPLQCQWNKVRLSHHHQGSQHLTPQDGKLTEAHVKMAIIEWQKPSTKGNPQKHKSKPLKIHKQKLALHCSQPKSLTLMLQKRCSQTVVDCNKYKFEFIE